MTLKLPNIVIETLIKALNDGILIQKQARLCDLAALDFIPTEILPYLKLHHQKAIARCSTTSKRILSNLTDYQNKSNVKAFPSYNYPLKTERRNAFSIAKDSNAPLDILEQLANSDIPSVRKNVALNPQLIKRNVVLNPQATEKIIKKVLFYKQNRKYLAAREIKPPISILIEGQEYFIEAPINSEDSDALIAAVSSPSLSFKIVEQLIENLNYIELSEWGNEIITAIASNPNIPISTLKWLGGNEYFIARYNYSITVLKPILDNVVYPFAFSGMNHKDSSANEYRQQLKNIILKHRAYEYNADFIDSLYWGIAHNIATPYDLKLDLLKRLTINQKSNCCHLLARSSNTPSEILARIANLGFYKELSQNPNTPNHILKNFAENQNIQIRKEVARNLSASPAILYQLAEDESEEVQVLVSSNPNTPTDILEKLEQKINNSILLGLVKNPSLPSTLFKKINRDYSHIISIQEYFAQNNATPMDILERLITHKSSYIKKEAFKTIRSIHQKVAANPEASIGELQKLVKHQDIEVRLAVIQHPQGLGLLLDRCLKPERCLPEQNSLNRVLAGMHPEISQQQIDNLFNSENWLDRLSVTCNPKLERDLLIKLAEDKNNIVKQTAKELLNRKD